MGYVFVLGGLVVGMGLGLGLNGFFGGEKGV